jgi:hypothetical protein
MSRNSINVKELVAKCYRFFFQSCHKWSLNNKKINWTSLNLSMIIIFRNIFLQIIWTFINIYLVYWIGLWINFNIMFYLLFFNKIWEITIDMIIIDRLCRLIGMALICFHEVLGFKLGDITCTNFVYGDINGIYVHCMHMVMSR